MSYANSLRQWFEHVNSAFGEFLPKNSPTYNMLSTGLRSTAFNFGEGRAPLNESQLYAAAMGIYADMLRRYYESHGQKEDYVYHLTPVETPYGTNIIDVNSGRRVIIRNNGHGKEIIGTYKDFEVNFGRGMASEAIKMTYDDKLYEEVRPTKSK